MLIKTKEQILEEHKWFKITGYSLGYDKCEMPPHCDNIIISKEEILKLLEKTPEDFWCHYDYDYAKDLDDAWETFVEDYCDEHNIDYNILDEELIEILSKEVSVAEESKTEVLRHSSHN